MKTTKQIAEAVFKIRDREQAKTKIRNRRIRKISTGVSVMCLFCIVILTAKHLNSPRFDTSVVNNENLIKAEVSTDSPDTTLPEKPSKGSENKDKITQTVTPSAETGIKETISDPQTARFSQNTYNSNSTVSADNNIPVDQTEAGIEKTTINNTTTAGPNPSRPTSVLDPENNTEPLWEEKTISAKFCKFDMNNITYATRNKKIESDKIGTKLCDVKMTGYDVYTNNTHNIDAEVFGINGVSNHCAAAIRFDGYNDYYVYTNKNYHPDTLGELVDDLDLNSNITFGNLALSDNMTIVSNYNTAVIKNLLTEYRACENLSHSAYYKMLFSISTNIDLLGIHNKSFAVTEDGYIITNIMDWRYTFYIGADKAQEIANKLCINDIDMTAAEDNYLQQEENIYE